LTTHPKKRIIFTRLEYARGGAHTRHPMSTDTFWYTVTTITIFVKDHRPPPKSHFQNHAHEDVTLGANAALPTDKNEAKIKIKVS